ncbi:MAG: hypothetical protein U0931_29270 [Vulcanimicrobiota bacterium]
MPERVDPDPLLEAAQSVLQRHLQKLAERSQRHGPARVEKQPTDAEASPNRPERPPG